MTRRAIDVEALVEEDREHLLNCAATLGSFLAQSVVTLVANAVAPRRTKHEYHPERRFTIRDVAKHLGVSTQTIRNRVAEGQLRAERTSEGRYRFRWADIVSYQEKSNGVHLKDQG